MFLYLSKVKGMDITMLKIHHIAIYTNNFDEMLMFYCDVLGCTEMQRIFHENGNVKMIKLSISEQQVLELFNFNYLNKEIKHKFVNWGYMHMGFATKDFSTLKKKLLCNNIDIVDETECGNDGLKHFFVEDPEKNLIEFTEI